MVESGQMVEWKESKYGLMWGASLAPGLDLSVVYSMTRLPDGEPKYEVSVFGRRLKTREANPDAAKARAVEVARNWMQLGLDRTCSG